MFLGGTFEHTVSKRPRVHKNTLKNLKNTYFAIYVHFVHICVHKCDIDPYRDVLSTHFMQKGPKTPKNSENHCFSRKKHVSTQKCTCEFGF